METAERHRVEVDLHDGLVVADAGVVGERRAEHDDQVALVHEPTGDGCAAATEHTAAQRMGVADLTLGLECRGHRCPDCFGQRHYGGHVVAGAGSDDHQRPLGGGDPRNGRIEHIGGRSDRSRSDPTGGRTGGSVTRRYLHLVGQHQVRHIAFDQGRLARERHELGVVRPGLHGLAVAGDVGESGGQIEVLERAASHHLRWHLTRDGQDRRPVGLGVVQAGEQIRRAGTGDGEAGGQLAGELAVRGGGERCGPLVANSEIAQITPCLGLSQRIGEPEIRVTNHAENGLDSPVHHGLDQHVAHRARCRRIAGKRGIDAVVADLHREARGRVVERRRR